MLTAILLDLPYALSYPVFFLTWAYLRGFLASRQFLSLSFNSTLLRPEDDLWRAASFTAFSTRAVTDFHLYLSYNTADDCKPFSLTAKVLFESWE